MGLSNPSAEVQQEMTKRQYYLGEPITERMWLRYQSKLRTIERQDELLRLAYEYCEDPENSPVTLNEVWLKLKRHFGD